MKEIKFKPGFIERYSKLTDFKAFKKASLELLERSIRVNTLKISVNDLKKRMKDWKLTQVPWCKQGFFVEHKDGRRDIGNTLESALGYIYVQEASSMIPPIVLNPKPGDLILDMCASPGSKTTQLAQMMKNKGLIVANDYKISRMKALSMNLQKCGVQNTITCINEGRYFKNFEFDKILVDAPCSGTGTVKKSLKTLLIWNPNMVKRLQSTQKQLLNVAFQNLKPKGTLVYSTCSVEPEENEEVVDSLLNTFDNAKLEDIDIQIKRSKPILSFNKNNYDPSIKKTLRIWPQDNDTCGFFVAKITKLSK